MRHSVLALSLLAVACAQPTAVEGIRLQALQRAATAGRAKTCVVPRKVIPTAYNQVREDSITMVNTGGWCGLWLSYAGGPYDAVEVIRPPAQGTITYEVRPPGLASTIIRYEPYKDFAGEDSFELLLSPNHVHEMVQVKVLPAEAN